MARKHTRKKAAKAAKKPEPSHAPELVLVGAGNGYERHRERTRERQAEISRSGRDIGALPDVVDPERREACCLDFRLFCETYFPARFFLSWSDDHLRVIAKIERAVLHGDLLALGMPRGSGKTSLITAAIIWALLYGHRRFVACIGSDSNSVQGEIMDSKKMELEANELLAEDFPEVCMPVRALDGITQRANGQLYQGERTRISWCSDAIVLPTIPGSLSAGSIVKGAGITARVRGMQHTLADGTVLRPDLVLLDDPQTDESAHSPAQIAKRERVIAGAILGLAGPTKKIAGFATVTVIAKDDLADRLLDRKRHPAWKGEKCQMVYAFPTATKLWDQYSEIYLQGLRDEDGNKAANAFYARHRAAMDKGSRVAWEAKHYDDELSAIQHAMNWRTRDEHSFFAECQNEPLDPNPDAAQRLTIEQLERKIGKHERGVVPLACHQVVAFIDVQDKLLWWAVAAFGDDFVGAILDYGAWPDQQRRYFTNRDATRTLGRAFPGAGFEGKLYAGLDALTNRLLARQWRGEGGSELAIGRILIDSNWGESTNIVYQFCRESDQRALLSPSHGRGITGSNKPLNEYERKPGDQVGHNWRIPATSKRVAKYVLWDTNYWKSLAAARFRLAPGDRGSIELFKATPTGHRMVIEHLTSEYPVTVSGRGREVDEWKLAPGRDNHLWDCTVGCFVAASIGGVTAVGHQSRPKGKRRRIRLSDAIGASR
jgi:hypothetical protein